MFYFSLPLIFYEIHLLAPGEFFLINCFTLTLLFFSAPELEPTENQGQERRYLLDAWVGALPLKLAFWPFFLLLNLILLTSDLSVKFGYISVSSWDDIHSLLILPYVWWLVSVWRCSSHASLKLWAALARLMTLWALAESGFILLIRIAYPRLLFSCDELFLNYTNCF